MCIMVKNQKIINIKYNQGEMGEITNESLDERK